eukprot:gene53762-21577_t
MAIYAPGLAAHVQQFKAMTKGRSYSLTISIGGGRCTDTEKEVENFCIGGTFKGKGPGCFKRDFTYFQKKSQQEEDKRQKQD